MVANWLRQRRCQIIPRFRCLRKEWNKRNDTGYRFYAMNAVRGGLCGMK